MRDAYKKLLDSKDYQEFDKNEKDFEFVHASIMKEADKQASWEFGFYNAVRDRIVVFETNPVKRLLEQEVFKEGPTINKLELDKVSVSYDTAMKIAEMMRKMKYQSEPVTKYIVILQNLTTQVWNITLVTAAFNLINIKVDAKTAEVISDNKHSIIDLGSRN